MNLNVEPFRFLQVYYVSNNKQLLAFLQITFTKLLTLLKNNIRSENMWVVYTVKVSKQALGEVLK